MMEAESAEAEDSPFEEYQPLPRPLLFPNKKALLSDDDDDEVNSDSGDSSDSDVPFRKRAKRTFDKSSTKSTSKYDVWAMGLRADNLMDEIGNLNTSSDTRILDKSRDVESYFEIKAPEGSTEEEKKELFASKTKGNVKDRLGKKQRKPRHQGMPMSRVVDHIEQRGRSETRPNDGKWKHKQNNNNNNNRFRSLSNASDSSFKSEQSSFKSERSNVKSRLGKRRKFGIKGSLGPPPDPQNESIAHGTPRELLDLKVTADSDVGEVVQDIANKLYEQKEDLIQRIVDVLGTARAVEIYNETKEIEAKGGMLVMNGTRRRTPGGVYIQLLKKGMITKEQMHEIFDQDRRVACKIKRLQAKRNRDLKYKRLQKSLSNKEIDDDDLKPLPTRKEVFASLCKSMLKTEKSSTAVKMEEEEESKTSIKMEAIKECNTSVKLEGEKCKTLNKIEADLECKTSIKTEIENGEFHDNQGFKVDCTPVLKIKVEPEDVDNCDMEIEQLDDDTNGNGTESEDIEITNKDDLERIVANKDIEDLEEGECLTDS